MPPRFQQRPRSSYFGYDMRQYPPQNMYPQRMYQQQYYQPMGQRRGPFRNPNPMNRMRQSNRGGGLLSRLLNRRQTPQPTNPFQFGPITRQSQADIPSWLNPDSISRFLGQTQQVLRTGQQIGGMIQQYGPIVKNLPALWKIYRGLDNDTTNNDSNQDDEKQQEQNQTKVQKNDDDIFNDDFFKDDNDDINDQVKENRTVEKSKQNSQPRLREKKSIPKIFI